MESFCKSRYAPGGTICEQIDPLYADRPQTYRSITINGLNKMIHRIEGDIIYIVDFWDTRREPTNQAAQTE